MDVAAVVAAVGVLAMMLWSCGDGACGKRLSPRRRPYGGDESSVAGWRLRPVGALPHPCVAHARSVWGETGGGRDRTCRTYRWPSSLNSGCREEKQASWKMLLIRPLLAAAISLLSSRCCLITTPLTAHVGWGTLGWPSCLD